ncbi:hypothetical protein P154DRAFT_615570 [Amniculicola lignicola CBS 123094]|uniref:Lysine-specific metallo-endopeptidase domain-containing protein n=1 Tax=Amniculicola lignicola CBS 123094 TaxID=1392246 RepID=A0A6A5X2R1_9PLEO|nr:hypothetical protein P154DRAFT_615570 [Amniculicola lignicola CBS 123094]
MVFHFRSLAASAIALLLVTPTFAYPVLEESPDTLVNITERQDGVDPLAVRFNFIGCDADQQTAINDAWKHLVTIGNAVDFDIDWTSQAAIDFLGGAKSAKYQYHIQKVIRNLHTWNGDGTIFAWKMDMHCDDYQRPAIDPTRDCPPGTNQADYFKCKSRCWVPILNKEGQLARWQFGAGAYTKTSANGNVFVGTMNFCPGFFALPTCPDLLASNIEKYPENDDNRINLQNYLCRTWVAIHELMHIDSNIGHAVGGDPFEHITDLRIRIWDDNKKKAVVVRAYGPTLTRTLAKWTLDTGHYVIRNADNLAMYCLSTWLTSGIGAYPKLPEVKDIDRPLDDPFIFSVYNYNGTITLNPDTAVLGRGLGTDADAIEALYYDAPQGCSDTTDDSSDMCIDDVANPAVDLQGPMFVQDPPAPTPPPIDPPAGPTPSPPGPTPAPKPNDFNCNCGESGCSADSMPCCANGSCACHCGESGCAAEDPICCGNGSCAPLPARMLMMGRM